jgi:hypothetical protein
LSAATAGTAQSIESAIESVVTVSPIVAAANTGGRRTPDPLRLIALESASRADEVILFRTISVSTIPRVL